MTNIISTTTNYSIEFSSHNMEEHEILFKGAALIVIGGGLATTITGINTGNVENFAWALTFFALGGVVFSNA